VLQTSCRIARNRLVHLKRLIQTVLKLKFVYYLSYLEETATLGHVPVKGVNWLQRRVNINRSISVVSAVLPVSTSCGLGI
jgi:hypothetical protein